jgi:hypothetical protein
MAGHPHRQPVLFSATMAKSVTEGLEMNSAGYFSQGLRYISISPDVVATQLYIHIIPLAVTPGLKQLQREAEHKLRTNVVIKNACSDTSTPQDA